MYQDDLVPNSPAYSPDGEDPASFPENIRLLRALRLFTRHDTSHTRQMFFAALCGASLIVLTGDEIDGQSSSSGSFGMRRWEPGAKIPLALFSADNGPHVLPIFSGLESLREFGSKGLTHCVLMPALQVMEVFLATEAMLLSLDPYTPFETELPRETIAALVASFQDYGLLPSQACVAAEAPQPFSPATDT